MRKIFSTVLVATALLFSMQANAVNVSTDAQLRNAIVNAAPGAEVNITLSNDIQLDSTLQIYSKRAEDGKIINLDLNGRTLSNKNNGYVVVELFKGTLNVSNGTIKSTATAKDAIVVHGVALDVEEWSVLNIKKDAKIIAENLNAITVLEYWGVQVPTYADAAYKGMLCDGKEGRPDAQDAAEIAAIGAKHYTGEVQDKLCPVSWQTTFQGAAPLAKYGKIDYTSNLPVYDTTVVPTSTKLGYKNYVAMKSTYALANGVKINIDGYVYGKKYGFKLNGNIKNRSTYMPQIVVSETAEIACNASSATGEKDATAFYCAGMGTYTIKGYVHGNIGVVVKAGDVTVDNAKIEGTGEGYATVTAGGSGMNGGSGCGIIVDTQKNYGGDQNVTIKGDSEIKGASGYALLECVPVGSPTEIISDVNYVNIEGGTITGGSQGAINITQTATEGNVVTVYGASVQGTTQAGTEGDLDDIKATGTFISEVVVNGVTTLVVSNGTPPEEEEYSINAQNIPASVIIKEETVTLDGNKSLGYVEMTNETEVTVPAGKTLKIEKLVMGDEASIVVEPGATVVISGEQGIVAGKANNIVLKADASGMGTFVLNPAVKSNRTPMATVQYYAKDAYCIDGTQYRWNIFASPFEQMTSVASDANTKQQYTGKSSSNYLEYWNGTKWTLYTSTSQLYSKSKAFQAIAVTNNTAAGNVVYTFKGKLQGNNDGTFNLSQGFNYIGNGYTAQMTAKAILDALKAAGASVQAAIYLWDAEHQTYTNWDEDKFDFMPNEGKIGATNMIVIKSNSDVKINLDYNELIWNQYKDL